MKKYELISKVSLWVLLAIGVVISALVFLGGNQAEGLLVAGDTLDIPVYTDLFLSWNYALAGIAVLTTIAFVVAGFVALFKKDAKRAMVTLCVVCAFVLLFVLCWFLGSPEKLEIIGYEGTDNQGAWAQLADMMMFATYALLAGTLVTIIVGAICTRIKK